MSAPSDPEVRLREVADGDLAVFFEHQRDPLACRMAAFKARDAAAFDAHWKRIRSDPSVLNRTVLAGGSVAGYLASFVAGSERRIAYWLGREFWNRGIATRALSLFLRVQSFRPLHAYVAVDNVGSRRVLEKCGFTACRSETGDVKEIVLVRHEP